MSRFMMGMRVGVGLVGIGYGIYRLSRGKRDWFATSALTSGFSMAVAGMTGTRPLNMIPRVGALVSAVGRGAPRWSRTIRKRTRWMTDSPVRGDNLAARVLTTVGSAALGALR